MQQADFVGVLRTILVILVIYYGLKIVARFAFPLMIKKFMSNVEKKFQQQQGQYQSNKPTTKVGETIIDKKPDSNQKTNDSVGDYVDYEEIE